MILREEKDRRKQHLNTTIEGGIEWIRDSHSFWTAVRQIYKSYKINKTMSGEWNDMAGCEPEEAELQYCRIAKKIGVPSGDVRSFLSKKIADRQQLIRSRYDGGECRDVLEKARRIAFTQIDNADSIEGLDTIIRRISNLIHQCACKGSPTRAPEIDENCNLLSDLKWEAMIRAEMENEKTKGTVRTESDNVPECDDEIPF